MKKYFFLGIGVGLIISGIFNFFSEKSDISRLKDSNILKNTEIIKSDSQNIQPKSKEKDKNINQNNKTTLKKRDPSKNKKISKNNIIKKEDIQEKKVNAKKEEDKYVIQLGAFGKKENAQEIIDNILDIELKIVEVNGMYKVITRPLSKKESQNIIATIKKKYGINSYAKKVEE